MKFEKKSKVLVITDDTDEVVLHTTKPRLINFKCINLKLPHHPNQRYINVTSKHNVAIV